MNIIILGAGFAGVAAACRLSESGHSVNIIDEHSFAGGDIVACQHTHAINGRNGCRIDQPNGRMKAELYGRLRDAGVNVCFMTRLCGLYTDGKSVTGAAFATKYGMLALDADLVIDCTPHGSGASVLTGRLPCPVEAEYGFDMSGVDAVMKPVEPMPGLGLTGDCVKIGRTMRSNTANISFSFSISPDSTMTRHEIERHAHELTAAIAIKLRSLSDYAGASVLLIGSHTRLTCREPIRDSRLQYIEAALPSDFTLADRRTLERNAESEAERLVLSYVDNTVNLSDRELISMGSPIHGITREDTEIPGIYRLNFDFTKQNFITRQTDVLVAGAGTGGVMAAWALKNQNTGCIAADALYCCGGTNTVGRVFGNWHGYNDAMFTERLRLVKEMAETPALSNRIAAILMWDRVLGDSLLGGMTVCGAKLSDGKIAGVLLCGENGFEVVYSKYVIDGTADGDVAAFAGLPYTIGGERDGMLQTSSMWGYEYSITKAFPLTRFNSDEDVIDPDSYADLMRGIGLGYLKNSEYEIVEMCMQRESRHFDCRNELTMAGIARRECRDDDIAVGYCRHDSHCRPSSLMNQFNLFSSRMMEAGADDIRIRMPLGMFLPFGTDNLAIVGKSMAGEREAAALCRMNPDISNSGYAVGCVVSAALTQGTPIHITDLSDVRTELRELRILPDWAGSPSDRLGITEAKEALSDPVDFGFSSMVQPRDDIVPVLLEALGDSGVRGDNAAMALGWHGCPEASPRLLSLLKRALTRDALRFDVDGTEITAICADGGSCSVNPNKTYGYVSVPMGDPICSYGLVNALIVLLGLAGGEGLDEVLKQLDTALERDFTSQRLSGLTPYALSRIDGHKLLCEDRLWSLIYACERLADHSAAAPLEKLLERIAIHTEHSYHDMWTSVTPPRITLLEIGCARAAAHCGSLAGAVRLSEYTGDARSVFSKMAKRALCEVYGEVWNEQLNANISPTVTAYRGNPYQG